MNILSFSAHKNLILFGHHRPDSGWISGAVKCGLFRRQRASFQTCKLLFSVSSEPFLLTKHLRERDLTVRLQYLLITHAAHFLVCCRVNIRVRRKDVIADVLLDSLSQKQFADAVTEHIEDRI